MEKLMLKDLLSQAEEKLRKEKYTEETIKDYKYVWNKFYNMCELFNMNYFDLNLAMNFLEKYYHVDLKNGKGRTYTKRMRSMYVLDCINRNKPIRNFRPRIDRIIPENFKDIFYEYDNFLCKNYSYSTIFSSESILARFLTFLNNSGITTLNDINIQHIYKFINSIDDKKYSPYTIYEIKFKLKKFFQYLYDNGKYKFNGDDVFPKIAKVDRVKLPSYYTIKEINLILEQVDRKTNKGKRDFAILLLAIVYGLRNSDIIRLKYENILWNENKIELIQFKKKKLLELPLTDNVKYALLDYLKNARPKIETNCIFLPTKPPYNYIDKENASSLYKSASDYIKKAGLDTGRKRGLHSLRHSMASNMLKNNIEVSTISSVLGHSSVDVTNIYLSIDEKQLRELALEVPTYG